METNVKSIKLGNRYKTLDISYLMDTYQLCEEEVFLWVYLYLIFKMTDESVFLIYNNYKYYINEDENKLECNKFDNKKEPSDFIICNQEGEKFLRISLLDGEIEYTILTKLDDGFVTSLNEYFYTLLFNWIKSSELPIEKIEFASPLFINSKSFSSISSYSKELNIYQLFEKRVKLNPNKLIFVDYEDDNQRSLSYIELYNLVNILSNHIKETCSEKIIIGVYLNRKIELIISLLAILKTGNIYLPLDASYPKCYIENMINDAKPTVLITDKKDIDGIRHIIDISNFIKDNKNKVIENKYIVNKSIEDTMAILYTSGSTGKPKGVLINEKQVLNRFFWMKENYQISLNEVFGQRCAISTIPSFWDLIAGILLGKKTVVIPENIIRNPTKFVQFIYENNITFITLSPSIIRLFCKVKNVDKYVKSLSYIITLGEKFSDDDFIKCKKVFKNSLIINDYGSTETSTLLYENLICNSQRTKSLGFTNIDNVNAYILDENYKQCSYYIVGELCVNGDCLYNGYLNSSLTEEKSKKIFIDGKSQYIFKTGDRAYKDKDNRIHILGRKDHIFKLHGRRVDLEGIKNLIMQLDFIEDALVIGLNKTNQIGCIIILKKNIDMKDSINTMIWNALENKIPEYMIPTRIAIVEKFPLLPNGKKDIKTMEHMLIELYEKPKSKEKSIKQIFESILNIDISKFDMDKEFKYLGMDSLSAMRIIDELQTICKCDIDISVLYNYPTLNKLINFLEKKIGNKTLEKKKETYIEKSSSSFEDYNSDFAIIGVSCIFPDAKNSIEFFDNLLDGKVSIVDNSNIIKTGDLSKSQRIYAWGCYLNDIDNIDMSMLDLTKNEIDTMDLSQKLSILEAYRAIENAGYKVDDSALKNAGVFVGAHSEQSDSSSSINEILGHTNSLISERISYLFDFHGPSMVVDTACSSSLVALHEACLSIKNKDCDLALVGGINIIRNPQFYHHTNKLNIFSEKGKVKPFSSEADGFVAGEGVGFILIKKLNDAIRDNDYIYAKIKGSIINQDGRSNGITAPNGLAQEKLMNHLYNKISFDLESVDYIECHGTGTKIGDVIELNALNNVYKNKKTECLLGSVKANIGHLIYSAGIAGIIKSLMIIQNHVVPKSCESFPLTQKFNWKESMFRINHDNVYYNKNKPITIAISSFGIGGTNCHCILEEYTEKKIIKETDTFYAFPLYSTNKESLKLYKENFIKWCEREIKCNFSDLSYTLINREYKDRIGEIYVANSMDMLIQLIKATLNENSKCYEVLNSKQYSVYYMDNIAYSKANSIINYIEKNNFQFEGNQTYHKVPIISSYNYVNKEDDNFINFDLFELISKYTKLSKNDIDLQLTLEENGLDSITLMNIKDELNDLHNKDITMTELYELSVDQLMHKYFFKFENDKNDVIKRFKNNQITVNELSKEEILFVFENLLKEDINE